MNSFFHKAYDKLLFSITPDLIVTISDELLQNISNDKFRRYLESINGEKIILPDKFFPERDFLQIHYERFQRH